MNPTLDEPVRLCEPDATWAEAYAAEHARIVGALPLKPEQIEHIGSTAVPGLAAKPVIDTGATSLHAYSAAKASIVTSLIAEALAARDAG